MAAHRHNKAGVTQANQALRAVVDVSRRNFFGHCLVGHDSFWREIKERPYQAKTRYFPLLLINANTVFPIHTVALSRGNWKRNKACSVV